MSVFLTAIREYYDIRHLLNTAGQNDPVSGLVTHPGKNVYRDALRRRQKDLEALVLGHPLSFDHCRCWMVDVIGRSRLEFKDTDTFHHILDNLLDGRHDTVDFAGKLARQLREFIEQSNIGSLTDSGMGGDSWHLGTHCTEREARDLCEALHRKYGELIERGILRIERAAWSLRLKDESMLQEGADGNA